MPKLYALLSIQIFLFSIIASDVMLSGIQYLQLGILILYTRAFRRRCFVLNKRHNVRHKYECISI